MLTYLTHGIRIQSAWPLAAGIRSLGPAASLGGVDAGESEVLGLVVKPGPAGWPEDAPMDRESFRRVDADHLLYWPILGAVRLSPSGAVAIEPNADAPEGIVPHAIAGPVVAHSILMQHGLVLHANCVSLDGRALAIVGPSGAGKSSLAAALIARGAKPHCDDVTSVHSTGLVPFGAARVKLNRDVLSALRLSPRSLSPLYAGLDKTSVEFELPEDLTPKPLAAIYRLGDAGPQEDLRCEEVQGFPMAMAILGEIYRPGVAIEAFGLEPMLRRCSELVGRARFFDFTRSRDLGHLDRIACRMIEHFRTLNE